MFFVLKRHIILEIQILASLKEVEIFFHHQSLVITSLGLYPRKGDMLESSNY
jgi:hypothetical protein